MAFPNTMESMAGLGQRYGGPEQTPWSNQFGLARKTPGELSPGSRSKLGMQPGPPANKPKRTGLFGEEEDFETSGYFNMYRPEKDVMASISPSQQLGYGVSNPYSQGNIGANPLPNLPQQRGFSGPSLQRSTPGVITPTSGINPNFPLSMQQQQASPNRSLISAIGQRGVISQSQVNQAISNLQKRTSVSNVFGNNTGGPLSTSMAFGFPRPNDPPSSGFDLSEFPTLGSRSMSSNPIAAARSYVGMVSKPVSDTTAEFQIQQEDFPALPGAQNPTTSTTTTDTRKPPSATISQNTSYEQALSKETPTKLTSLDPKTTTGATASVAQKRGIQIHPDGTVSNIPSGMVVDQFGIVGLLTFIRAAETDPNLVALAPGIDLTTLGLNLNSPENLYSTFQSPWADSPCRPQDIDFHVPAEYLTNIYIREKLAAIKLNRYSEDLLFFLFYMYGGDVLQLAAAAELYTRDWRYHREERVWITRAPGCEPVIKTNSYERGTYYSFDVTSWRKVAKEFYLEYDKLEERPHLPSTLHHNPNMPIPTH